MRILIVLLLLVGGAAAIFYITSVNPARQRSIKPGLAAIRDSNGGERDEDARLEAELAAGQRNRADSIGGDNPPSVAPGPPEGVDHPRSANQGSSDSAEQKEPETELAVKQLADMRLSFETAHRHELEEAQKASSELTAARKDLEAMSKDRAALSARVADLGAENAKLRSSAQKAGDLVIDQRRSAERATQNAAGIGSDLAAMQKQLTASNGKVDDAVARSKAADERFTKSDTLAKQLQARLAEMSATNERTVSHITDQLAAKNATANQRSKQVAELSAKLEGADLELRTMAAGRAAANGRMALAAARQSLAFTGLQAARISLAREQEHVAMARRAADQASDKVRALAGRNDALTARDLDVRARLDATRRVLARTAAAAAALQARLQLSASGQRIAQAALSKAQGEKTQLALQTKTAAAESAKTLGIVRQQNATLTGQAARLPDLDRKIETLEKTVQAAQMQQGDAQKTVVALKLESAGQLARIDALIKKKQAKAAQDRLAQAGTDPAAAGTDGDRVAKLQAALTSAQAELAQAGRDAAAAERARQAAAKALAENDATLQTERRQKASSAAETSRQLESASARAEKLASDLGSARRQLAQAARDTAMADTARRSSEQARAESNSKLEDERKQAALLSARAAKAAGDVAQLAETGKRLAAERETTHGLEIALASSRTQLAQAAREITSGRDARHLSEQAEATANTKLEDERRQTALLAATTAKAANGAAQSEMGKRLAAERETTHRLEMALASSRSELAQAVRDKTSADDARRSSEKALAGADARRRAARAQGPVQTRSVTSVPGQGVVSRPPPSLALSSGKTHRVGETKEAMAAPSTIIGKDMQPMPSPAKPARTAKADSILPDAVSAHVLLRYAHDKARVQVRAQALGASLKSLGLEVNDAATIDVGKPGNSVTYFYKEDRGIADRVAKQLEAPAPIQSRGPGARAPRPGTIEVVVGG